MTKVQRYWPVALSGACFATATYLSLTDTAYRMMGCPIEVYPEAGFLLVVGPFALIALVLAIKGAAPEHRSRFERISVIGSVVLSVFCVGLTVLLLWPTGSGCS
jgi:hypothetical protein